MQTHIPVLLDEVLRYINPQPGGRYIDATFGAGGHTRQILERSAPDGRVLAIDQDQTAIEHGRLNLQSYGSRLEFAKANFRDIASVAPARGFAEADGILADIGVSSMMLDDAGRGFSFMREGPLDMRMNPDQPLTAAGVVNTYSEKEIANILFNLGEERRSRQIAASIVRSRPLTRTTDLTRAVERVLGGRRFGKIHPATRTFQALRIFVNDELKSLEEFLDSSMKVLRPGGRLVLVSFHSLEDRIIKNRFRTPVVPGLNLTKKVITAADEEITRNPRARSARLRAWEKS
jgi:16S rRNA (cytosine1402-N4)-methyltransferase